jgi:hypothetical protein
MLRGFKTLLATLVVAGMAAGVAAAGETTNDVRDTMPFFVFIPCANGGATSSLRG